MLRVLVGLIILYDHVHPNGAFVKTSNINVKGCIRLLKEQPEEFQTENLLNALRYTYNFKSKTNCVDDNDYIITLKFMSTYYHINIQFFLNTGIPQLI